MKRCRAEVEFSSCGEVATVKVSAGDPAKGEDVMVVYRCDEHWRSARDTLRDFGTVTIERLPS